VGEYITVSEWARRRNAQPASLYKWLNDPLYEFLVDKPVNGVTRVLYPEIENQMRSLENSGAKRAAENRYLKYDAQPSEGEIEDSNARLMLEAKLKQAQFAAENERIKAEKAMGKLIGREEVNRLVFDVFRQLRNQILRLPDRFAAEIAGVSDPRQIHIIMTEQLVSGLQETVEALSSEFNGVADSEAPADE
jgi:hypothetical protein